MLEATLPPALPDDSAGSILDRIWQREPCDQHVAVAHGYNIQLRISGGQLIIRDGMGRHQRERKYPKADRTLRRVVITGTTGYITLEAYRWCAQHGITVTSISPDAELVSHYASAERPADAKMIRTQVLAGIDGPLADKGIEVAQQLLSRKLDGQAANLVKLLGINRAADRITHLAAQLADADSITGLEDIERWSAQAYFDAWSDSVAMPWSARDRSRVPSNWLVFGNRKNSALAGNTKRNAADPVNAMLNYGYAIGYGEARSACIAHGLNPAVGFMHSDKSGRDSLALDVMETVRPEIEAFILGLLGYGSEPRSFSYRDFAEPYNYPAGTVRVVAPLTHEIAEQSWHWQKVVSDAAHEVVRILSAPAGRRSGKSHVLKLRKAEFQTATVTADDILTADDWARFLKVIPARLARGATGLQAIDDRIVVAAMVYLRKHHKPWAHVPPSFGVSARTLNNRRLGWSRSGHWPDIEAVIEDIASRPDK